AWGRWSHLQSLHRCVRAQAGAAGMEGPHPGIGGAIPAGHRRRDCMDGRGRDVRQCRQAAQANLRSRERAQRPSLHPDRSQELSQLRCDADPGHPLQQTGSEHDRQNRGHSINATVSFTVPQTIAVAEAVERGLKRREAEGLDISTMGPVCTIMVGRLDDWLKVLHDKHNLSVDPGYLEWAGVAVFKKAYKIYRDRGYRLRLLSAAFRNHMHWSEFIGGDVVIS